VSRLPITDITTSQFSEDSLRQFSKYLGKILSLAAILGCILFSWPASVRAQSANNEWVWMNGSNAPNASGLLPSVYGTQEIPAAANNPGSRTSATTWTDTNGNLWLFSGHFDGEYYNDFWKLDPSTAEWTWMGGSNADVPGYNGGVSGSYGTMGTPSAGNIPGGRLGAVGWTDKSGTLWLLGGYGLASSTQPGYLNDLWKYDPSANQWAWMGGSNVVKDLPVGDTPLWGQPGVYGTRGASAATNVPGSRQYAVSWTDSDGNFWLFGGKGMDSTGTLRYLNDLWKYNPSSNQWTWVSGSSTVNHRTGEPGVYGNLGSQDITNTPGGRANALSWTDSKGNLWLFGGFGVDAADASGCLDDLWTFDTSTSEWIWMGGHSLIGGSNGESGVYGSWMTPSLGNHPGGREASTAWTDKNGNFWLYGGVGVDSNGVLDELDDLWEYSPSTNQWAWMGGHRTFVPSIDGYPFVFPNYGTMLTPNAANSPGGLDSAVGWTDKSGNPWLYGGFGYSANGGSLLYNNDLWEYQPTSGTLPIAATPSFSSGSGSYPAGQTLAISDATPGATIYYVTTGAAVATQYINPITISSTERIDAVAVAAGYAASADASATYTVSTVAAPSFSLAPGEYPTAQTVTLADNTPGATIYYAINATPTTASNVYSGPITVSTSETIEAIAEANGYADSPVSTAVYTIWPTTALNVWAWMGGPSIGDGLQVYSALGTAAFGNLPKARYEASSWSDRNGNFWLFGGEGGSGGRNDLWKFDPSKSEWAWMSGTLARICPARVWTVNQNDCTESQPGVYGTLGTPAPGNTPGGREGASSWVDNSGNFWIFGGYGLDANGTTGQTILNDLWKFNPATSEWTWMSGSSTVSDNCFLAGGTNCGEPSVYGSLGVPAAGNTPGSRTEATTWTDNAGNLWLFGGWGWDVAKGVQYYFDELWKFNPSTSQWAWMGGSSTRDGSVCFSFPGSYYLTCGEPGVYGTTLTPSSGNIPGSRAAGTGWTDSSGNLWLFSGNGFDANGHFGDPNDVWKFNPSINQWAWMGGNNAVPSCNEFNCSPPSIKGTLGTAAAGNIPRGRDGASGWTDSKGNFWLFGGGGGATNELVNIASDDLWVFNPSTNEWAWMGYGGRNLAYSSAVYGTQGAPAPGNGPGNRYGASNWSDSSGNLWLFGGYLPGGQYLYGNDLWEYQPSAGGSLPTTQTPTFSLASGTYSTTQTVTIGDATNGSTIYYTTDGSTPTTSSAMYSGPITFPYSVTLMAMATCGNCQNSAIATANYTLPGQVAAPTFSLPSGTYSGAQSITISDSTIGVNIFYTTDGTNPAGGSALLYGPPVMVANSETIRAIAVANGYGTSSSGASSVASATYTINLPQAATPTFSLQSGTYSSVQTVTLNTTTPGGVIYYTADGTTPTTNSTGYVSPISVSTTQTIKAISIATGYSQSSVATATYTITLPNFTLSGTAITVKSGATSGNTSTITLTPSGGFNGVVSLNCAISPVVASNPPSCSIPGSVTISGAVAQTTVLTVTTTAPTSAFQPAKRFLWHTGGGAVLACILMFGIKARGYKWQAMLGTVLLLLAIFCSVSACGGGSGGSSGGGSGGGSGSPGTPAGTYAVTVTGTSGTITQTASVTLTVR
jgi:N-acetylneuraminic acid mutarotase